MQAITTKYLPATNVRGSRIKATCAARSVTVSFNDSLSIYDAHKEAAATLILRMGWGGEWHGGGLPDERGFVFVCVDEKFPEDRIKIDQQRARRVA